MMNHYLELLLEEEESSLAKQRVQDLLHQQVYDFEAAVKPSISLVHLLLDDLSTDLKKYKSYVESFEQGQFVHPETKETLWSVQHSQEGDTEFLNVDDKKMYSLVYQKYLKCVTTFFRFLKTYKQICTGYVDVFSLNKESDLNLVSELFNSLAKPLQEIVSGRDKELTGMGVGFNGARNQDLTEFDDAIERATNLEERIIDIGLIRQFDSNIHEIDSLDFEPDSFDDPDKLIFTRNLADFILHRIKFLFLIQFSDIAAVVNILLFLCKNGGNKCDKSGFNQLRMNFMDSINESMIQRIATVILGNNIEQPVVL